MRADDVADDVTDQEVRMNSRMDSRTNSDPGLLSSARTIGRSVLWVWDHSIGWLVRGFFLVLIVGYQRLISPLLPASCRYHPSCSAYGFDAIAVHGSAKGLVLTLWRLLRCTRGARGVDPVPDKDRWLQHPPGRFNTNRTRHEHAVDDARTEYDVTDGDPQILGVPVSWVLVQFYSFFNLFMDPYGGWTWAASIVGLVI